MKLVFVSGVELGRHALSAILENEEIREGTSVLQRIYSLDEARARRTSGFVPFDDLAEKGGVELCKVKKLNTPENVEVLKQLEPDILFVIGWSELVSREILDIPTHGCIGMHPTLLPKGRGRAPIPWAIIKGLKKSGVTMFYLEEGADTGDIIGQKEFGITLEDDAGTVYEKVARIHYELMKENLPLLLEGRASRTPQDHSKATVWEKRTPEDGVIDWSKSTMDQYNWIRALTHPYPGAFTFCRGKKVYIWKAALMEEKLSGQPGDILDIRDDGLVVACNDGSLLIKVLQAEDGAEQDARTFAKQYGVVPKSMSASCFQDEPKEIRPSILKPREFVVLRPEKHLKVLAIAPHADDIELGCGATIMRLVDEYEASVYYHVMTVFRFSWNLERLDEAKIGASRLGVKVDQVDGEGQPYFAAHRYYDSMFPDQWRDIQRAFDEIHESLEPDLVITPSTDDVHQDHVTVAEAAMRVFRSGESIWHYWIPQFDQPLFVPNFFVNVTEKSRWKVGEKQGDKLFKTGIFRDEHRRVQEWKVEVEITADSRLVKKEGAEYLDVDGKPLAGRTVDGYPIAEDIESVMIWGKEACVEDGKVFRKGSYAERKAELLQETFFSERGKKYFDLEIIMGTMSTRGQQWGRGIKYAEGFQARISI